MLGFTVLAAIANLAWALSAILWAIVSPDSRVLALPLAFLGLNLGMAWLLAAGFHDANEATRLWKGGPATLILGLTIVGIGGLLSMGR